MKILGTNWRPDSKIIIGAIIFVLVGFSLQSMATVNPNYANTEDIMKNTNSTTRVNICAENDRAVVTNLIRENKNSSLDFEDDEGEGPSLAIFNEAKRVCKKLIEEDSYFASLVTTRQEQQKLRQLRLEKKRKNEEALRAKYEPILKKWDEKALKAGYGDLREYLSATSRAKKLIESGAQYSLTGTQREVQNASCSATQYSSWSQGEPDGWWSCYINFLGGSDLYSVEFSNGNWSGKADGGRSSGRDLNWNIPQGLLGWIATR